MTVKDMEADLLLIQEQLATEIDDERRGQLRREYRALHARWLAARGLPERHVGA